MLAGRVAISEYVPPASFLSILNPSSLSELSVHESSIVSDDAGVAVRLVGAAGGVPHAGVVIFTTFEYPESPAVLYALTRYQYCVLEFNPVSG